jgi:hypothetical protein
MKSTPQNRGNTTFFIRDEKWPRRVVLRDIKFGFDKGMIILAISPKNGKRIFATSYKSLNSWCPRQGSNLRHMD